MIVGVGQPAAEEVVGDQSGLELLSAILGTVQIKAIWARWAKEAAEDTLQHPRIVSRQAVQTAMPIWAHSFGRRSS